MRGSFQSRLAILPPRGPLLERLPSGRRAGRAVATAVVALVTPALPGLVGGGASIVPLARPLAAQVPWDAPLMVAPSAPLGWGVYLTDPSPGAGIGIMTTWRGGGRYGYRIGLAEDDLEDVSVFGGVDVSGSLVTASDDFPLDVHWVTGAGFGVGDAVLISVPLGLSLGRAMEGEGVWVNPYVTPRVVLDALLGSDDDDAGELDLGIAVDLGFDLSFDPGWAVRFGGSLGNREALSIGFSFRLL